MSLGRREFVGAAAAGLLSGCASRPAATTGAEEGLAADAVRLAPRGGSLRLQPGGYPTLDRPRGHLRIYLEGWERPLYILVLPEGGYAAVLSTCTHLRCTVRVDGWQLVCPCHGSTFARDGRVLLGPAREALAQYPVRLAADGTLTIDLTGTTPRPTEGVP